MLNKIHILERKASQFYQKLRNLDLNGKLNPGSFYKIKKQITKQAEVKTAVVDNKGNLLTNKQLIVNEYQKLFKK